MCSAESQSLAAAFQTGDDEAFIQVWNRYAEQTLQFVRRYISDTDDIDEVLQEIRISLAASRDRYIVSMDLGAWTYGVCRYCCFKWMRAKQKRHVGQHGFADTIERAVELESEVEASAIARDVVWDHIANALAKLTVRQREVIQRRIVEEQSIAEVAASLHCAPGTVKATTHMALQRMRQYMERTELFSKY